MREQTIVTPHKALLIGGRRPAELKDRWPTLVPFSRIHAEADRAVVERLHKKKTTAAILIYINASMSTVLGYVPQCTSGGPRCSPDGVFARIAVPD